MSLASNISDALGGKKSGKGYTVVCPCHASTEGENLMVSDSTDKAGNPDISVHCFGGCDWKRIKDHFRGIGLLPKFEPAAKIKKQLSKANKLKTNFIWKQAVKDEKVTAAVLKHRAITTGFDSPAIRKGIYKGQEMLVFAMTKPLDEKVLAVQQMQFNSET
nr:hypothetical protein [Desulfobacterales bacterium]